MTDQPKKIKANKKDGQLLIRINSTQRDEFIQLCEAISQRIFIPRSDIMSKQVKILKQKIKARLEKISKHKNKLNKLKKQLKKQK